MYSQSKRRDPSNPDPDLPWIFEVSNAADIFKTLHRHIEGYVKAYAEKKPTCYWSIDRLIAERDWRKSDHQLEQTLGNLHWFFRDDPQGEVDMRCIIERIQEEFDRLQVEKWRSRQQEREDRICPWCTPDWSWSGNTDEIVYGSRPQTPGENA